MADRTDWYKKFKWSLSDNTVATFMIIGDRPTIDDLAFLDQCLQRAQNTIEAGLEATP